MGSTTQAIQHKELLKQLKIRVEEKFVERGLSGLFVKAGSGAGFVARVPWIFITRRPGPVSTNIGVAICFGREGNGLVLGLMYPVGQGSGQKIRPRRKNDSNFIDVDGDTQITRYNSRFIEPVEIHSSRLDSTIVFSAVFASLQTLP
jgi:hypothetical protein